MPTHARSRDRAVVRMGLSCAARPVRNTMRTRILVRHSPDSSISNRGVVGDKTLLWAVADGSLRDNAAPIAAFA